jgi:hypothetical protein
MLARSSINSLGTGEFVTAQVSIVCRQNRYHNSFATITVLPMPSPLSGDRALHDCYLRNFVEMAEQCEVAELFP